MSPLIYLSCAWAAGVLAGTVLLSKIDDLPYLLALAGLTPLPFLLLRRYRRIVILASLCLAAFFAAASYSFSSQSVTENDLSSFNGTVQEIKGTIYRDPEVTDKSTQLYFSATGISAGGPSRPVDGKTLLFVPRNADYQYGDVLKVTGELETPPQLDDFDYAGYLAHQGIGSIMYYPHIETQEGTTAFKPLAWVYDFRDSLAGVLARTLPEPQASLAQGLVLGIRTNIPPDVKNDFIRSGTAHLLAISGVNLSIIAGIMLSIGIWLFGRRRYLYVWLALAVVWLYALLTGMHPPVVRGAIMASLFLGAELFGRQKSAFVPLTLAAAVMVGISPYILRDASFQLSFVAMAGLVFLYPALRDLGRKLVARALGEEEAAVSLVSLASDSFAATLAATIFVWPLIAYYFGIVSLVSPIATLLALPALPATIILGTLSGAAGIFFLPVAQVIGLVSWLFLSYILLVAHAFALPPVSIIQVGTLSPALFWAYYAVLALALWLWSRRDIAESMLKALSQTLARVPRKRLVAPLVVIAILVWSIALTMPDDKVHVSFLNVGQGDAILIARGSQQILVDGGPSRQAITRELSEKMPFWDRSIDLVVLTHPHEDHLAGLVEVSSRYDIGQAAQSTASHSGSLYDEWRKALEAQGIAPTIIQPGQEVRLGEGLVIAILHPGPDTGTDETLDANNNSLVLRVEVGKVSFLLTSDIGQKAESMLLQQRARVASTVLKVAHHGSGDSNSGPFIATVRPQAAVISVGENNEFGHPSDDALTRLGEKLVTENIYRSDVNGTIEFITDGERLWVKCELPR